LAVFGWSAEDAVAEGERVAADVEVTESVKVVEGELEVDIDLIEPVNVMADVDLVAGRDVGEVVLVGRDTLFVALGSFKVFAVAVLLSLSSPQIPVSQGLEEQQPE
jgi:hypothetical protein